MSKGEISNVKLTKELWKDIDAFISEEVSQLIINNPIGPETPNEMLAIGKVMLILDRAKKISVDQARQLDFQYDKIKELEEEMNGLIKIIQTMNNGIINSINV